MSRDRSPDAAELAGQGEEDAVIVRLPDLGDGLPPPPPAPVDPYLDAAERCFARHGVRHTSVQDVARELRVDRTTVYRQVGNIDSQLRLLTARELHRALADMGDRLSERRGPEAFVEVIATLLEYFCAHPVLVKIVADEPEMVGPLVVSQMRELLGRAVAVAAPLLEGAMASGEIAHRDPIVIAEWIVRIGVSAALAPPRGDLRGFLSEVLVPVLRPAGHHENHNDNDDSREA